MAVFHDAEIDYLRADAALGLHHALNPIGQALRPRLVGERMVRIVCHRLAQGATSASIALNTNGPVRSSISISHFLIDFWQAAF